MHLVIWKAPYTTTEQDLRQLFEPYGTVARAQIIQNEEKRNAHGLVDMPNHFEGLAAIEKADRTLGGQEVHIQRDRTQERAAAARQSAADDLATQRTALTAALKKQRETLTTVQHQLAGSRKPRWGAKRVAALASLLTVSTEDLCAVWWEHKPLGAIQVRVEEKLRQIEAEMANPDATLRQRRDLKLKHLLSWAKSG
jgi:hypothetical protein